MVHVETLYDAEADQIVFRRVAAEGEDLIELLRLDVKQLSADERRRLRDVRDPDQDQPAPGDQAVTRR